MTDERPDTPPPAAHNSRVRPKAKNCVRVGSVHVHICGVHRINPHATVRPIAEYTEER